MYHKEGAYDGFDRLHEVVPYYRRCRTLKMFILSDAGVAQDKPKCAKCGKLITADTGNRGEYHKRTGVRIYHYTCAWEMILQSVYTRHPTY